MISNIKTKENYTDFKKDKAHHSYYFSSPHISNILQGFYEKSIIMKFILENLESLIIYLEVYFFK